MSSRVEQRVSASVGFRTTIRLGRRQCLYSRHATWIAVQVDAFDQVGVEAADVCAPSPRDLGAAADSSRRIYPAHSIAISASRSSSSSGRLTTTPDTSAIELIFSSGALGETSTAVAFKCFAA